MTQFIRSLQGEHSVCLKKLPGLKYDVKEWLSKISAQELESPKLIQGEIRSAATKNDETKGVRLVKK